MNATRLLGAPLALLLLAMSGCGGRTELVAPGLSGRTSGSGGSGGAAGSCPVKVATPCTGPITLQPAPAPATQDSPVSLAAADLNGDCKPDLVVSNTLGDGTLSVLLGHGDGTFAPQLVYTLDAGNIGLPQGVAVGDLDGDGVPDVAVAGLLDVAVLIGHGDGTFAAEVDYPIGAGIDSGDEAQSGNSVAIADLNGDGKLDLAVANNDSLDNSVSVLLNNGDGTFAAKVDYATGKLPMSIVVRDLNGDGTPDLVVANYDYLNVTKDDSVSVLLNNGDGTFAPEVRYATGINPTSVAVADFDGDGKPDLAVVGIHDSIVSVLLNKGGGTFASKVDYPTGAHPDPVVAVDMDGDGKVDLVTANAGNTVSLLRNQGDGTFAAMASYSTGTKDSALDVFSLVATDLNGDGRPDLAAVNNGDNTVIVLLGGCAP